MSEPKYSLDVRDESYKTKPNDINTSVDHYWSLFGKNEIECEAKYFIKMCQTVGKWGPMSDEVAKTFPWLKKEGYLEKVDGEWWPMHFFITKVYGAFPAVKVKEDSNE